MEIMRLYNTMLVPGSDTLLDLGASTARWNNLYVRSVGSIPSISASSLNTTILVGLSSYIVGEAVSGATISTASVSILTATSSTVTSERFFKSIGSSLALSNSANAYLNVQMLTHNAASTVSGDVYFFASSNRVYLSLISNNATYYVAMNT